MHGAQPVVWSEAMAAHTRTAFKDMTEPLPSDSSATLMILPACTSDRQLLSQVCGDGGTRLVVLQQLDGRLQDSVLLSLKLLQLCVDPLFLRLQLVQCILAALQGWSNLHGLP